MRRRWVWAAVATLLGYLFAVLRTSWVLTHPKREYVPKDYTPPEMPRERVTFPSHSGVDLAGWVSPGNGELGTVIFCHGIWANHLEMDSRAEALWKRGFGVMTFDFQGCGESRNTHKG